MKKQQKLLVLAIITAFIATALFLPGLVSAGDLEPDAAPGSTMHTLDEIYNKLDQLVPGGGLASVEKTGQTTSHETGDDGDLSKGVTWPNPRFTDNNDGTVTDNLTGLVWLKDANRFGSTNWADALIACNALAADGTNLTDGSSAGDWRLPNIKGAALMKQVKTAANRGGQHYQHWLYATFWQDNPVAEGYLG
jgi:hypothetical protein